jgi:hypothetical protein
MRFCKTKTGPHTTSAILVEAHNPKLLGAGNVAFGINDKG